MDVVAAELFELCDENQIKTPRFIFSMRTDEIILTTTTLIIILMVMISTIIIIPVLDLCFLSKTMTTITVTV